MTSGKLLSPWSRLLLVTQVAIAVLLMPFEVWIAATRYAAMAPVPAVFTVMTAVNVWLLQRDARARLALRHKPDWRWIYAPGASHLGDHLRARRGAASR